MIQRYIIIFKIYQHFDESNEIVDERIKIVDERKILISALTDIKIY